MDRPNTGGLTQRRRAAKIRNPAGDMWISEKPVPPDDYSHAGGNEEPSGPCPSSDLGALGALVVNPSVLFSPQRHEDTKRWSSRSTTLPPTLVPWWLIPQSALHRRTTKVTFRSWRQPAPSSSSLVLQEGFDLVMRPAKVENQSLPLALKNEPQIQAAATFHERRDAP